MFDDDHYYMGSVIAELLSTEGYDVSLATPLPRIASWMVHTLEHGANQQRLHECGVTLMSNTMLMAVESGRVLLRDTLQRRDIERAADGVVMVTARLPEDGLYHELREVLEAGPDTAPRTLRRIGDCLAPGIIATAVYEGHRYARELGAEIDPGAVPFRRERHVIEPVTA